MTYNTQPCPDDTGTKCAPGLSHYSGLIGCGANITASFATISSPSYPYPYPNNVECIYQVTQPMGTFIEMKIIDIDINCEPFGSFSDFLEIRDGDSESSPLMDKFCGNKSNAPTMMETSQNNLWIRLI